jgi:hypothetical protein
MANKTPIFPAISIASAVVAAAAPAPITLVICAPGYPGTTKEAQPSMDKLRPRCRARPVGRSPARGRVSRDRRGGRRPLKAKTPSLALVPLPFSWPTRAI